MLFHNYKLLQFFDTLGLYFCMESSDARGESAFLNVPRTVGDDVTVTVTPVGEETYRVSPYPFASDPFVVTLPGKVVQPDPSVERASVALERGESSPETITLVS